MTKDESKMLISTIRKQAVQDFWTHEQELLKNGMSTRDWTPDQIESIMNISEKTGIASSNGNAAYDIAGKSYYGHHMKNVADYPEYAGDWRNIQALDYEEHYNGAHGGNTHNETNGFYNYEKGETQDIDITPLEIKADVKDGESVITTQKSIFKSDSEIEELYSDFDKMTDGQKLALKNFEYSLETKESTDLDRTLAWADKYKSKNEVDDAILKRIDGLLQSGDDEIATYVVQNMGTINTVSNRNNYDVGKALINNVASKNEDEMVSFLMQYSEEILKCTDDETIRINRYVVEKGGNISLVLPDDTLCIIDRNSNPVETVRRYDTAFDNSKVYLNEKGEVIGRSYTGTDLENIAQNKVPDEYSFETRSEVFKGFSDDDTMRRDFGDAYDDLSAKERFALKELDYLANNLDDAADAEAKLAYMKGAGIASMEDLGDVDKALIRFASKHSVKDKEVISKLNNLLEIAQDSEKLNTAVKHASGAGRVAGALVTAYIVYDSVKKANDAFIDGRYGEAAGYVAGTCANVVVSNIIGAVATDALLPYFVGVGMALGGPVGALLGGVLAGVVGGAIGDAAGYATEEAFVGLGKLYDERYADAASVRMRVADPLVLDLDGDGFELLSVEDGVYFDADSKGLIEKTQWIAPDDALLALDLNNDGIINDGSELFGTATAMPDGSLAKSGFEALMQYDLNGDGRIDSEDDIFSDLKVWQDKNSDGISQEDEVKALADIGVSAIELTSDEESGEVRANLVVDSGKDIAMDEFGFASQLYNTKEKEEIEISDEIIALPDVQAMGSVKSLHTLMQLDETGVLKGYVAQFAGSTDVDEKKELVTKILYFITGADDIVSNSRGGNIDAKQLRVIEQLMGKDFVGTAGPNPVNTAGPILKEMYKDMEDTYYSMLNAQTELKPYMGMMVWKEDENGKRYLDTEIFDKFVDLCTDQGYDMSREVSEVGFYIHSMNKGNEDNFGRYASKYIGNRTYFEAIALRSDGSFINGDEGNNTLWGTDGIDIIKGGEGNDTINAGNGVDVLIGGRGDDKLTGGAGSDVYIFNQGDGNDTVDTYAGTNDTWKGDKIRFNDVKAEDVEIQRKNNQLILVNKNTDDRITINAYYNDSWHGIGTIEFANGTIWDHEFIGQYQMMYESTDGNNTIYGYDSGFNYNTSEIIDGGAGN
ncbi:MAG: hypothetical protein K6E53_13005, partial [Lachnospiraceae bacterium]|nr:hypothetical protein [Lachnospiraceae bacterium]